MGKKMKRYCSKTAATKILDVLASVCVRDGKGKGNRHGRTHTVGSFAQTNRMNHRQSGIVCPNTSGAICFWNF